MKLKKDVKVLDYNPSKELRKKNQVRAALLQCLEEGDTESFKDILSAHIRAVGVSVIAEKSNLSIRTINNSVTEKGNPTLETIAKILKTG